MKKLSLFILLGVAIFSVNAQNINVDLLSNRTYGTSVNDVWGYVDTVGLEYALVGVRNGFSVVNVDTPTAPVQVDFISGPNSTWRDIKTWGKYAYVSTETNYGLLIVDMSPLPGPITNWTVYNGNTYPFNTVHNLFIDENGVLYILGSDYGNGGAIMLDLTVNPMAPTELGVFNANYLHDGMARGDTLWGSAIYAGELQAIDVTNKSNPVIIGSVGSPHAFTHNAWVSDDGDFVYTTDEVSGAFITGFDVTNLGNITEVDRVQSNPSSGVIVHNTHYYNDYLVTSYYKDGITIVDATYPYNLIQTGNYDTYPQGSGGGFAGCWGTYPWLPSGNILATDGANGLFVLGPTYTRGCYLEGTVTEYGSGNPLNNVQVDILTTSVTTNTDPTGFYATAILTPGTYNVQFSKTGYVTQTITGVDLANGVLTVVDVELHLLNPFTLTGQVVESWSGNPVPDADVKFENFDDQYNTTTDGNGDFSIPGFLAGTYELTAGKWTFVNSCFANELVYPNYTTVIPLDSGYYDDYTFDFSWTVSGNATQGAWERAVPLGTVDTSGNPLNPALDVNNDCSTRAYITGNSGVTENDDDVDGGTTIFTSAKVDLSAYLEPHVFYSRWFYSNGSEDTLRMIIDNGQTTVVVEVVDSTGGNSMWLARIFRIIDFITPTDSMHFIFEVSDNGAEHIVEAGIDKWWISDVGPPVADFATNNVDVCIGDTVYFTDNSSYPMWWDWSFPGGSPTSDTVQNPAVVYNSSGTYDVTLIVSNTISSDTSYQQAIVTVWDLPVAAFTADKDTAYISQGGQVQFTDASSNATSWFWDFGDTQTSTQQNPAHTYSGLGNYTVQLTASNPGCSNDTSFVIVVMQDPIGIEGAGIGENLSIYPNPFTNQLVVSYSVRGISYFLEVYDIVGQLIDKIQLSGSIGKVAVGSDWSSGTYLMKLSGSDTSTVTRVVKY